jgi:hypothetical protein
MQSKLAAWVLVALLAGCQARNPYAAFGPATIPAPGMQAPQPYYPATASTASPPPAIGSSAASGPTAAPLPGTAFVADATDNQPIRIVENPAALRTATAPATPTGGAPVGSESYPAAQPGAERTTSPALNRLRGFIPAAPATHGTAPATFHADPRVAPAGYQQPLSGFSEAPAAAGQWKAR